MSAGVACVGRLAVDDGVSGILQSSLPLIRGFRPDRSLVQLPLALELGVVKATCVAERPRAVGAAPPFRRVDPVAAVAPPGRSRALGGKLAFCVCV